MGITQTHTIKNGTVHSFDRKKRWQKMKFVKGIKTIENGYLEKIYIINPKTIIKIEKMLYLII